MIRVDDGDIMIHPRYPDVTDIIFCILKFFLTIINKILIVFFHGTSDSATPYYHYVRRKFLDNLANSSE